VGRLDTRHKGQDVLLETLSAPVWRGRRWHCRLFGDGPDREYLAALAGHYELDGRVELAGHAEDIREVWATSDLAVMPSRMEGAPLALVEAMVCGRPAVVTDVAGMTEWVDEPGCGFVAEAPTARAFGNALERAWARRSDWPAIGASARKRALELIDPDPGQSLLDVLLDHEATP